MTNGGPREELLPVLFLRSFLRSLLPIAAPCLILAVCYTLHNPAPYRVLTLRMAVRRRLCSDLNNLCHLEFITLAAQHQPCAEAACRSNTGPSAATNPCTEGRVQLQCAETAHAGSASCWGDDNSNSVLDFKALFEGQGHKEPVRCSACGN